MPETGKWAPYIGVGLLYAWAQSTILTFSRVVDFVQPEELMSKIDVKLKDEQVPNDELETLMEQAIQYSVKTGERCNPSSICDSNSPLHWLPTPYMI